MFLQMLTSTHRWRWVVSCTLRPIYRKEKRPQSPLRMTVWTLWSAEQCLGPLREWNRGPSVRNPTELSRLSIIWVLRTISLILLRQPTSRGAPTEHNQTSESLGLWTLSTARNSKWLENTTFQKLDMFPPSGEGDESPTLFLYNDNFYILRSFGHVLD
jgi:hypothetical protein